jgi:hypothetical protein
VLLTPKPWRRRDQPQESVEAAATPASLFPKHCGHGVGHAFLFFRERFPMTYDLRQTAEGAVYDVGIRKDFCYVSFQYDNVTSAHSAARTFHGRLAKNRTLAASRRFFHVLSS